MKIENRIDCFLTHGASVSVYVCLLSPTDAACCWVRLYSDWCVSTCSQSQYTAVVCNVRARVRIFMDENRLPV